MVTEVVTTSEAGCPVYSRVSWGALLAGAAVALAVYSLLTMLGIAIGVSVSDRVEVAELGMGMGIWAFVSLVVSLFFGGWVATQCTVGENRTEAMLYGVIVWGLTLSLLMWMTAAGLAVGFSVARAPRDVQASATTVLDQGADRANARNAAAAEGQRDANREMARDQLQAASWWTFGGMVVSLFAAIGGALLGPYEFVVRRDYRGARVAA